VGTRHAHPLCLGQRLALLQREREPPARGEGPRHLPQQRPLVAEGKHGLEEEHDLEGPRRQRRDLPDVEAAGQAAGALAGNGDRALARVDTEVVAAEPPRQETAGACDSTAQVEHPDAWADAGPFRQAADLGGAYEALLLDVLAGAEGRLLSGTQGLDEHAAVVPAHGLAANRCMPRTVVSCGCSS